MSTAANGQFIIGNYRVGQAIGEGTFGKVRLGVHIPTDMKVAVKTLQKEKIVEQADIERVTREICILKILRHPNIVQLYEIIESKTDIHLIMEYAPGGELFDYIVRKKRLDEQEAVTFMQQIVSGVEYIHKIGIVHRDLKPENLLFDENKRIKIVDFGLSNQYKPGEKLKTACGSPCYAAPEMIAGKRYECLNIDVWSCGIILYAMLCGYLPFEDPNTNKLYKKIMMGEYEQPKVLTPDSKQMLKNMLNVNPDSRFKINQVKDSRWFNLTGKRYEVKGIVVGNDTIVPDQTAIAAMRRMGVTTDVAQIKNYIVNNRHNHITAFYYLLKKKAEKNPGILQPEREEKRSNSPLIYKPEQKKDFFMPFKKTTTTNDKNTTKVNDSFNASKIVSSLVEANKTKIISNINNPKTRKTETFEKLEEFKLFPKQRNGSQYEPSSPNTTVTVNPINLTINSNTNKPHALTSRNDAEDKKINFSKGFEKEPIYRPASRHEASASVASRPSQEETNPSENLAFTDRREATEVKTEDHQIKNKRREELSDQLKQISLKIDKQILELRKHNNMTSSMMSEKRRESFGSSMTQKFKAPENKNITDRPGKTQVMQPRMESQPDSKLHLYKQMPTKFPKMHFGPFNAQCLMMQAPHNILLKMGEHLKSMGVQFKEVDLFSMRLQSGETVSVESIHGIAGYHIVKFSSNSSLSEGIIEHLTK